MMANNNNNKIEERLKEKTNIVEEIEKIYIVETPVEGFCGIGAAGVQFAYGKAEVHEGWVLDWFKEHGYKVIEKK